MPSPYPYETATPEQREVGAWWWCVHHEVHVEPLTEPVERRVEYIMEHKAVGDRERRLTEMRPVINPHRLPAPLIKAWAAYEKARAAYEKAGAKARAAYEKARAAYEKAEAKAWAAYDKAEAAYKKARAAYEKARAAHEKARAKAWAAHEKAEAKAWAAHEKARAAYEKARAACEPDLMALHREEYPDTRWDGKSIFGKEASDG